MQGAFRTIRHILCLSRRANLIVLHCTCETAFHPYIGVFLGTMSALRTRAVVKALEGKCPGLIKACWIYVGDFIRFFCASRGLLITRLEAQEAADDGKLTKLLGPDWVFLQIKPSLLARRSAPTGNLLLQGIPGRSFPFGDYFRKIIKPQIRNSRLFARLFHYFRKLEYLLCYLNQHTILATGTANTMNTWASIFQRSSIGDSLWQRSPATTAAPLPDNLCYVI
jgi:hypothetical protein